MAHGKSVLEQLAATSQAQTERLFHMDFKLYFLGTVNRHNLLSRLGIKKAASAPDLALFKELAPKNIKYDSKANTYVQRQSGSEQACFTPLFEYSGSQTVAARLHTTRPLFRQEPNHLRAPEHE